MFMDYIAFLQCMEKGMNMSEIAASMHISRPTAYEIRSFLEENKITLELALQTGNLEICAKRQAGKERNHENNADPDFPNVHKELAQKGVTLQGLWNEYRNRAFQAGQQAFSYPHFCRRYAEWAMQKKLVMRIAHKPGDTMEVDWSGLKLGITDRSTGEKKPVSVFVMALPYSMHFFWELCPNEQTEAWINAHIKAFSYFKGVCRIIVPDNLKAGVTRHERLDIVFNKTYEELCSYYGITIVPARVRSPTDKSHAEGTVKIVENHLISPLRKEVFYDIESLRERMTILSDEILNRKVKALGCSRKEFFEREEAPFLKPLPREPYEMVRWSIQTVKRDYLIDVDGNKYSVPYQYVRKKVEIRISRSWVEVYFRLEQIARHERHHQHERNPVVLPEHMPPNHLAYLQYTKEKFMEFAHTIGPNTEHVFQCVFDSCREPEQAYPSLSTLKKLAEKNASLMEMACEAELRSGRAPDLKQIDLYFKNPETLPKKDPGEERNALFHSTRGLTRGMATYGHAANHPDNGGK